MRPHPYVALEPQCRQIRLLHLQPGQPDDGIECRTSIVSFDEKFTDYEALSYVWGERLYYGWISLDGSFFPVTENLWGALSGLRYADRERVMWIDAICIDQANVRERSEQVSRMHSIFTQASTVIVWLGEAWDTTEFALGFFEMFGLDVKPSVKFPTLAHEDEDETDEADMEVKVEEAVERDKALGIEEGFGRYEEGDGHNADEEDHADEAYEEEKEGEDDIDNERVFDTDSTIRVKNLTLDPVKDEIRELLRPAHTRPTPTRSERHVVIDGGPVAKAVKRFMGFSWWTRIWTVQEFVLASASTFHCGKYTIDGTILLECVRHFQRHDRNFNILTAMTIRKSKTTRTNCTLSSMGDGRDCVAFLTLMTSHWTRSRKLSSHWWRCTGSREYT